MNPKMTPYQEGYEACTLHWIGQLKRLDKAAQWQSQYHINQQHREMQRYNDLCDILGVPSWWEPCDVGAGRLVMYQGRFTGDWQPFEQLELDLGDSRYSAHIIRDYERAVCGVCGLEGVHKMSCSARSLSCSVRK